MTPTDRWLGKLTALRPAQGKTKEQGAAPHKPLLLLCLIDLAEAGQLTTRAFTRTPGLVLRFRTYGTLVSERWPSKLDLKLPFYHLSSQGFWEPFTGDMRKATGPDNCLFCELHEEFFQLLSDADFRLKARLVLISRHFAPIERISLFETLGLEGSQAGATAAERVLQTALESAKRKGRCAKFQVRIVDDYRHTCALTGYRCFTVDGSSVVDAAHIESWSQTQNGRPRQRPRPLQNRPLDVRRRPLDRGRQPARHRPPHPLHRSRPRSPPTPHPRRSPLTI